MSHLAAEEALARLDRRTFLRLAGVAGATALLPSGCGGVPENLAPPPGASLRVLSPRGYATFQALSLRLVGAQGGSAIRERRLDPAAAADAWVAHLPALGGVLAQGLVVLEWGVWPLLPKWRPFTALDGVSQDRVFENLQHSRLDWKQDLYHGLKSLGMLVIYAQPQARTLVGHPGPFAPEGIAAAMRW